MFKPSYKEAKELAQEYNIVPIIYEMPSDSTTPINVLKALKSISKHCFLFESVENSKSWSRYSFLGYEPNLEIKCLDGKLSIKDESGEQIINTNPKLYLQGLLEKYSSPKIDDLPSFTGGLVGYFAYDFIKYTEPSLKLQENSMSDVENFYDIDLMLFKKVIVFDNYKQKLLLIVNIEANNFEEEYTSAIEEIERIKYVITNFDLSYNYEGKLKSDFKSLFNEEEYCQMVETAKQHIFEGDIFQVVLSNRLEAEFEGSLLNTYRSLRMTNPSPYMFYFSSDTNEIAGASPETLVKLENSSLFTFPLAGTRPRGKNNEEDSLFEEELLNDEKELAEHNMLVDLGRNDLGKISKFSTVEVVKYKEVHKYSHVMHIGSTVCSKIKDDCDGIDAIEAVLPAGTLSGAPKIKACEIINKLEKNKRGIYGGAIGYLDFKGNMDTCIAIRLCFKKNNKVYVRSGAGIVADSLPKSEYQECINKAKAVMNALENSENNF